MQTVLWIAGVGVTLLLAAFGCLIGLIYLMTSPIFQRAVVVAQSAPADAVLDNLERDRRRRAAAVAVAIARAEATELPPAVDTPADWRVLHRSFRMHRQVTRRNRRT